MKGKNKRIRFAAGAFAVMLIGGIILIAAKVISDTKIKIEQQKKSEEQININEFIDSIHEQNRTETFLLAGTQKYLQPNLSYKEEVRSYREFAEDGKQYFQISYPVIEGLHPEIKVKVNNMLEECAMETAEALSKKMEAGEICDATSRVDYQITYFSDEVISVIFQDSYGWEGAETSFQDLRTKNIDLTTGEEYKITDFFQLSDEFLTMWHQKLLEQNESIKKYEKLTLDRCKEIVESDFWVDDRYRSSIYFTQSGIELGFTYHYNGDEFVHAGWVTALLTGKEVEPYVINHEFLDKFLTD